MARVGKKPFPIRPQQATRVKAIRLKMDLLSISPAKVCQHSEKITGVKFSLNNLYCKLRGVVGWGENPDELAAVEKTVSHFEKVTLSKLK
jgi:hypothetical protein